MVDRDGNLCCFYFTTLQRKSEAEAGWSIFISAIAYLSVDFDVIRLSQLWILPLLRL